MVGSYDNSVYFSKFHSRLPPSVRQQVSKLHYSRTYGDTLNYFQTLPLTLEINTLALT
jgi:hypothetical protein